MRTVCEKNQCTGCAACVSKCSKNAISIDDNLRAYNAVINEALCVNCGQCENVCQMNHTASFSQPILWKQGWALDEQIRKEASSGGLASAIAKGFVRAGGIVCSCVFEKGVFIFDFADTEKDVSRFVGSKYVKSNPDGIYKKIKEHLTNGKKVLFIGLPCQAAAVKAYMRNHSLLYTVDLICHGTPSPTMLQMFLKEKGYDIKSMRNVKFRKKTEFYLFEENKGIEPPSVRDRYTFAFLRSLCYTETCYSCQYATTKRVSDLTLGDSWGSELSVEEQKKGISLVLCQNEKGEEILSLASLHLEDVVLECAIANNRQLNRPSEKPIQYELFYRTIEKKKSFSKAVAKCYPKDCFRQKIKAFLVRIKIIGKG